MYAVFTTGGKQYRVSQGDVINVELLAAEAGEKIDFDQVLMVANGENIQVGQPMLAGAKVSAEVLGERSGDKITTIKIKRRKHHMKKIGHKQHYLAVKITEIQS